MLKVLVCEPKKAPYVKEIKNDLPSLQEIVGGYIEVIPVSRTEPLLLVCNEEGKLKGLPPNRNINNRDILVGTFFLVRSEGEEFTSLNDEDIEVLSNQFGGFMVNL